MSMSFESNNHNLIVHGDFDGEAAKRRAMFLADLMAPGGTNPGDLDPHNFEDVRVKVAGDIMPYIAGRICQMAHVEIDFI